MTVLTAAELRIREIEFRSGERIQSVMYHLRGEQLEEIKHLLRIRKGPALIREDVLTELKNDPRFEETPEGWRYLNSDFVGQKRLPKVVKRARNSFSLQIDRCTNRKSKVFCYYGMKKVKVIWSEVEFVNFFINQILTRELWYRPVTSRNLDCGDYRVGNVQIKECWENSQEIVSNRLARGEDARSRTPRSPEETSDEILRLRQRIERERVARAAEVEKKKTLRAAKKAYDAEVTRAEGIRKKAERECVRLKKAAEQKLTKEQRTELRNLRKLKEHRELMEKAAVALENL